MWSINTVPYLKQIAVAFAGETKLGYVPQVAFICNKPAMHMAPSGSWESDANVGCLNQPKEILDYCKKVFYFVWNL